MRIKEPFLLIGATLWILGFLLPKTLYRGRTGKPFQNQLMTRIGFVAIGLALLLLWFSLPSN
jgi:hypothetical protein